MSPSLWRIFSRTFRDCVKLRKIGSLENVTWLGYFSFQNTPMLKVDINLPKWVDNHQYVGDSTFSNSGILSFSAPLMEIAAQNMFYNCKNLEKVSIPNVKTLGNSNFGPFDGCENLSMLEINWSIVEYLGGNSFRACSKLFVEELNTPNLNGFARYALQDLHVRHIRSLGKVTSLPNGNTAEAQYNYGVKSYLESISFPEGVTAIPRQSLNKYIALKHVTIPSTVTSIAEQAFGGTTALPYLVFPQATPPSIASTTFTGTSYYIYVPDASLQAYKTATNWSAIATRIKPISEKPND